MIKRSNFSLKKEILQKINIFVKEWKNGESAFYGCNQLLQFNCKSSGLVEIKRYAFKGCNKLRSFQYPSTLETVGEDAFYGCSSIKKVEFSYGMEKIPDMACQKMSALVCVEFPTEEETTQSDADREQKKVSVCAVSSSSVVSEEELVKCVVSSSGAVSAEETVVPVTGTSINQNEDATTVTIIGADAFNSCTSLQGLELPANLKQIDTRAFYDCTNLQNMIFPEQVKEIAERAFADCSAVEQIVLNEGLETIKAYAFSNCSKVTEVQYPKTVNELERYIFSNCSNLEKVIFSYGMEKVPDNACYDMDNLKQIVFEDSSGKPITEETGEETTITEIGENAFYSTGIETLALPKGIEKIHSDAFGRCYKLTEIIFADTVEEIGYSAFSDCNALEELYLPENIKKLDNSAFSGCKNLVRIEGGEGIENLGSSVFYAGWGSSVSTKLVSNNPMLKSYDWTKDGRVIMYLAQSYKAGEGLMAHLYDNGTLEFEGQGAMDDWTEDTVPWKNEVQQITNIAFSEGVTTIGSFAFGHIDMYEIVIPEQIQSIHANAFYDCNSLLGITFENPAVAIDKSAFFVEEKKYLWIEIKNTTEEAPGFTYDWEADHQTVLEDAVRYQYDNCSAYLFAGEMYVAGTGAFGYSSNTTPWSELEIRSLEIREGITGIGGYSLFGQEKLKNVTIASTVETIGPSAFEGCTALERIRLPLQLKQLGNSAFKDCTSLEDINLGSCQVEEIGNSCFQGCSALRKIVLNKNVKTVKPAAFKDCAEVRTITMEEGVATLGAECFSGCNKVSAVMVPRSVSSVTGITEECNGPFAGCEGLTTVSLAAKARTLPAYLLAGCTSLTTVKNTAKLISIEEYAFAGCSGLSHFELPESLGDIKQYAFWKCTGLKKIEGNQCCKYMEQYAFAECSALEEIIFGERIETLGEGVCKNASALKKVSFGPRVKGIPAYAFAGTGLEEIALPYSTKSIGEYAFAENPSLAKISIPSAVTEISETAFDQESLCIICEKDSYAEGYAKEKGYLTEGGQEATDLTLKKDSYEIAYGERQEIVVELVPVTAVSTITCESSNEDVVEVSQGTEGNRFNLIGKEYGTATITVKAGSIQKEIRVTVKDVVRELVLSRQTWKLTEKEDTYQLETNLTEEQKKEYHLVWYSNNESIVSVDQNGVLTPHKDGSTKVFVSTADGSMRDFCQVTVKLNIPVEGIYLDKKEIYICAGTIQLNAQILPSLATNKNVDWYTDDEDVVSVDQKGCVSFVGEGETTVWVETEDGDYRDSCKVYAQKVAQPVSGVSISQTEAIMDLSEPKLQLSAKVEPENATIPDILWSSSNREIATVDENGLVTGLAVGEVIIRAETKEGGYVQECKLVIKSADMSVSLDAKEIYLLRGEQYQLTETVLPTGAAVKGIWYSNNTNVATVSETGNVIGKALGTAVIKYYMEEDRNIYAECTVHVVSKKIPVEGLKFDQTTMHLGVGETGKLDTVFTPADATNQQVLWEVSNEDVIAVENGTVTAKAPGISVVTATAIDGNFEAACTVMVSGGKNDISGAIVKIGSLTYTYTGDPILPVVIVKYKGNVLVLDQDYKVTYTNNQEIGTGTILVEGIGEYTGSKTLTFQIAAPEPEPTGVIETTPKPTGVIQTPAPTSVVQTPAPVTAEVQNTVTQEETVTQPEKPAKIKKLTAKSGKKIILKWEKGKRAGVQIQYSTKKNFKKAKTAVVTGKTTYTIQKGKAGRYYVRVRAFNKNGKEKVYSAWSAGVKAKKK